MSEWTIYHNPKCSKSRQTLALLEDKGVHPNVIEYLQTPPSTADLKEILSKLGKRAVEIVRTKEDAFKELKLDWENENEAIKALVENPKLIERPIVVHGEKAVLGRPPENVLSLLE